jgi:uncharacterized protein (DUF1684 family)
MALSTDYISLADWRRTTAELYAGARAAYDPLQAWAEWVDGRDRLFKEHTQTPLTGGQRRDFRGLPYYPYDKRLRTMGRVNYNVEPDIFRVELEQDGLVQFQRLATVHFRFDERPLQLSLFWILGYGGGLFLPFKDGTNGISTFGGGRYLYDTIKGADLGAYWESIVLDFNFAYNPSCAYNDRWSCPLAPQENHLAVAIEAGEKLINDQ